jgi:hypothetical protein
MRGLPPLPAPTTLPIWSARHSVYAFIAARQAAVDRRSATASVVALHRDSPISHATTGANSSYGLSMIKSRNALRRAFRVCTTIFISALMLMAIAVSLATQNSAQASTIYACELKAIGTIRFVSSTTTCTKYEIDVGFLCIR